MRIAVDIGTNGEVLLGSRERLWACSAPAGPALEGAQIRHGMRAAIGAIDRVGVEDGDLRLHTIGDGPAQGICGSGLIDAVAALLDAGRRRLDRAHRRGRARPPARPHALARARCAARSAWSCSRAPASAARSGRSSSPRTTSARCSSARAPSPPASAMLQHVAGVGPEQVEELMLAGGFGNYLSMRSALRIGLIPPVSRRRRSATSATRPRWARSSRWSPRPSARRAEAIARASSTSRSPRTPTSRPSSWTA